LLQPQKKEESQLNYDCEVTLVMMAGRVTHTKKGWERKKYI